MTEAKYKENAGHRAAHLSECAPCETVRGRFWTLAVVTGFEQLRAEGESDEVLFARIVAANEWAEAPHLVGRCGQVPELLLAARCSAAERTRTRHLKGVYGATVTFLAIKKGGQQEGKVLATIEQMLAACVTCTTNLEIVKVEARAVAAPTAGLTYEAALELTLDMGTERFIAMVENAKLKKARREEVSDLECVCMSARSSLLEVIKLRQDATEWEIEVGSSRHTRAAPLSFDEAATPLAKSKAVYRWEPTEGRFLKESVQSFLDGTGHLISSFVILGQGGAGKSRLLHAMATELAVGAGKPRYLFGKSLDALGILSFAGSIRRAGCLVLTDADLRVARGAPLSAESFKSLFDVEEGGALQDTRYRPAQFGPGLARLMAWNGTGEQMGLFMRDIGQGGIANVVEALLDRGPEPAAVMAARASADEQAILRRISWCLCRVGDVLVAEELKTVLRAENEVVAATARERRKAFWEAQRAAA
jgi:hypothetical protein